MKMSLKIAIITLSLTSAPLFSSQETALELLNNLKQTVGKFEQAITKICVKGDKSGISALLNLEKNLHLLTLAETGEPVSQMTQDIFVKFQQVISKVCSILKSNKPLNEITLDLTNNFDAKKMFPEVINDLQKLASLAQKNNYQELSTNIEDLIKQIQVEQKKWSNPPATALVKFIQSIKAYFKS